MTVATTATATKTKLRRRQWRNYATKSLLPDEVSVEQFNGGFSSFNMTIDCRRLVPRLSLNTKWRIFNFLLGNDHREVWNNGSLNFHWETRIGDIPRDKTWVSYTSTTSIIRLIDTRRCEYNEEVRNTCGDAFSLIFLMTIYLFSVFVNLSDL